MNILVSACLLGLPARYDGKEKACPWVLQLGEKHTLIPVCPEQMGGLPTPRTPSECQGAFVTDKNGVDRTEAYERGAACAMWVAEINHCSLAILKQRSPSCGSKMIYDGSFTGRVIPGAGVAARTLQKAGLAVFSEEDQQAVEKFLAEASGHP